MTDLAEWFNEHRITEVECLVPDITGIPRGKIMPAQKFLRGGAPRLPESIFIQSVTGEYPEDPEDTLTDPAIIDINLIPDPATVRLVPWAHEPTAQIIHDCQYSNGRPVTIAPRQVLRHVLELYKERGWQPVLAPELEFYLVGRNTDPDYPLVPPVGRSGRQETGRQSYSIDAVNEFDPLFEEMYDFCEMQELDLDTLIHEEGAAQVEINFLHGDPLNRADQVFLFKRTVREVALRHDMYATFMAKPMGQEPGSAMHVHQSVVDLETGRNLFADQDGRPSQLFLSFIAGLQKYIPAIMPIFAPNVNSYRRLTRFSNAPINLQWGHDNRTCGLRVPYGEAGAMRVENRVPGADANPYLAFAASLACGYLGMMEGLTPTPAFRGSAYSQPYSLPRELSHALEMMEQARPLIDILGQKLVEVFVAVKRLEYETYLRVISSWEREHLLLNV
ncbi:MULTISPECIES: glutamine synthetase family protein [Acidiphilium]|jgi:glutamine synthetase|uniref:Glutamate--putrescine ligase n=2 Tax=Acidiphilium TaxID=522 RepID=A5FVY0_ACICJ|nr:MULTISPECIES: glutamine synthetase family protein [Acidiphilium]MBU6355569.1 glutamine synthetase family protein [Rhodospirillales bacterium]ABQ29762.1 Glutamate--putrescine ligase [Acidiphilium cryptum JF-5]EGO96953.1 Glutamate--putrescine ligase [Acidiphilium sp. PM]KDM67588.1 gamma-glutamylputrescine synthetase PuuA [Acidiphilium sp. JA12-A1]MBS3023847.1 glutamine synthetase [Acidiphilium multivorum]